MGRIYTVSFSGITITNAGGDNDLFEVSVPSDMCVALRELELFQTSDVGDSEEEILRVEVRRMTPTVTSGNGTSVTPAKTHTGDVASSLTCERVATTIATTTGSNILLEPLQWQLRVGLSKLWVPSDEHIFSPSEYIIIRLPAAPADDITGSGMLKLEEIGG